jgi:uncharacterized membrane protein YbhN (UPF0104 family)
MAAAKLLTVAMVLWFVRNEIHGAIVKLRTDPPEFQLVWLVLSGGLYLAAMLPAGLFWHGVLKALGQNVPVGRTLRAYFIGHLGKYVPGKAMVVVLRAGLLSSPKTDTSLAAVSVFVETLTMMAVGASIAAVILLVYPVGDPRYFLAALACTAAVAGPTVPPVFRRLVPLLGVGRSDPEIIGKLRGLTLGTLLQGWLAMAIAWLIMGMSLWAALRGIGGNAELSGHLLRCVAAISLATVVGFLTMVPAGLGTREGALILMLAPLFGEAAAVSASVVLRLVSVLAELVISGALYFVGSRDRDAIVAPCPAEQAELSGSPTNLR